MAYARPLVGPWTPKLEMRLIKDPIQEISSPTFNYTQISSGPVHASSFCIHEHDPRGGGSSIQSVRDLHMQYVFYLTTVSVIRSVQ